MSKRRPNGDGMVRKRPDGRWEARIIVGHKEDGKPIYKSVFGKTQSEAMTKFYKLLETYRGVELNEALFRFSESFNNGRLYLFFCLHFRNSETRTSQTRLCLLYTSRCV